MAMGAEKVIYDQINFVKGEEKRQSLEEEEIPDEDPDYEEIPYQGGNMTHVVEIEKNQDGHFLGRLKKVFKKFRSTKRCKSKK